MYFNCSRLLSNKTRINAIKNETAARSSSRTRIETAQVRVRISRFENVKEQRFRDISNTNTTLRTKQSTEARVSTHLNASRASIEQLTENLNTYQEKFDAECAILDVMKKERTAIAGLSKGLI